MNANAKHSAKKGAPKPERCTMQGISFTIMENGRNLSNMDSDKSFGRKKEMNNTLIIKVNSPKEDVKA